MANDLNVDKKEADKMVDKYFATKPSVRDFINGTKESLKQNGYVETLQGHRRQLRGIFGDKKAQGDALRQSVNTVN